MDEQNQNAGDSIPPVHMNRRLVSAREELDALATWKMRYNEPAVRRMRERLAEEIARLETVYR